VRATLIALVVAAAASLSACRMEHAMGEDTIGWGTVLSVQDAPRDEDREELTKYDDDHPRVPEVGWKIVVQPDDGDAVVVLHNGTRRYTPGERVRLLFEDDGALLL
jgi:outer membrane lipoprotein SlyB